MLKCKKIFTILRSTFCLYKPVVYKDIITCAAAVNSWAIAAPTVFDVAPRLRADDSVCSIDK